MTIRKSITDLIEDLNAFKTTDKALNPNAETLLLYAEIETLISRLKQEKSKRKNNIETSGVTIPDEEI